jgi:aldehyde dehydrogenase (NAD+)
LPELADTRTQPYSGFDQVFIGGRWRKGGSDRANQDLNPWTGEILTEIPQASRDDLDEAYASARDAQRGWAAMLPSERAAVMRRAASVMEACHDEIVWWLVHESGSTWLKASLEWQAVYGVLGECASLPYLVEGRILPNDAPGKESRVYRRPVGVVGVISPWNWPLQLTARSLFPALAVGNAVVVKPASDTPVTGGLLHARILEEAGLPPGVLSVTVGAGREIGDAFLTHPVPRVHSRWTPHRDARRRVARDQANRARARRQQPVRRPRGRRSGAGGGSRRIREVSAPGPDLHERKSFHRARSRVRRVR